MSRRCRLRNCRARALIACVVLAAAAPRPCAAQLQPAPPDFAGVFAPVPMDLWRFLSVDTAIVLGAGGGAALVAHTWDDDLADEVETNPQLNNALSPGNTYGAFSFQATIGVSTFAVINLVLVWLAIAWTLRPMYEDRAREAEKPPRGAAGNSARSTWCEVPVTRPAAR